MFPSFATGVVDFAISIDNNSGTGSKICRWCR
jgi:hypothetical protein